VLSFVILSVSLYLFATEFLTVVSPLDSNSTYTALVWKEGWVVCGGYLDLPGCRFLFTRNPGRCVWWLSWFAKHYCHYDPRKEWKATESKLWSERLVRPQHVLCTVLHVMRSKWVDRFIHVSIWIGSWESGRTKLITFSRCLCTIYVCNYMFPLEHTFYFFIFFKKEKGLL
jgi:hypothetical protein